MTIRRCKKTKQTYIYVCWPLIKVWLPLDKSRGRHFPTHGLRQVLKEQLEGRCAANSFGGGLYICIHFSTPGPSTSKMVVCPPPPQKKVIALRWELYKFLKQQTYPIWKVTFRGIVASLIHVKEIIPNQYNGTSLSQLFHPNDSHPLPQHSF